MTATTEIDPFETTEKRPSLKFPTIGTSYTVTVTDAPNLVQSRDFESGELATWDDGKPKMSAVINVVTADGEEASVWATKPSALFAAIADAQKKAGAKIGAGGSLTITYTSDKANPDKPRLSPAKQFEVVYTPGTVFDTPAAAPAAPPSNTPNADQASMFVTLGASTELAQRLATEGANVEKAASLIALDPAVRNTLGYPA